MSVTSRCSIEAAGRIDLILARRLLLTNVLQGISVFTENKATSLWNFSLNSGHRKSRHTISIIELSSKKVDAVSVINWTVVGQLKPRSQRTNSTELNCCARTAALQPINFVTLTPVTNNASYNWVNLVQVSSVQFISSAVNTA